MIDVVVTIKFMRVSMFLPGLVSPFYAAQIIFSSLQLYSDRCDIIYSFCGLKNVHIIICQLNKANKLQLIWPFRMQGSHDTFCIRLKLFRVSRGPENSRTSFI
jgi:hypothetical protein